MGQVRLALVLCAFALTVHAQLPGQYPPGTYPPGRFPGQGQGGRGQGNPNANGRTSRDQGKRNDTPTPVTTSGLLRVVAGSQFVLGADDHRVITYRTSDKTTVRKDGKSVSLSSLAVGDHLTVDSTADQQGYFTAGAVTFDKAGTADERAAAAETWDLPKLDRSLPTIKSASAPIEREPGDDRPVLRRKNDDAPAAAQAPVETASVQAPEEPIDNRPTTTVRAADPKPDDDDSGPPQLRRGGPAPRRPVAQSADSSSQPVLIVKPANSETASARAAAAPAPVTQGVPFEEDPVIAKAKEAAASFAGSLPNFFCQQVTTRYQSDHPKTGWDALDVVTADVAYEDGHESYKNIKVGNKSVNKGMDDLDGTRSTGEFSSILEDLFSPTTAAVFRKNGQESIHGRTTFVYKYEVVRERSHWRVEAPSQLYYPAFRGTVWIDKETSRVLRLEQETRNMPLLFPFDTVETATDYDFVRLAVPEPFLLPVDAEVLSCVRGSSQCSRNRIEFRNYRKFGAESDITFGEKKQ